MKTIEGSEMGMREGNVYETEEIKLCPKCGCMVIETYRAEELSCGKVQKIKD